MDILKAKEIVIKTGLRLVEEKLIARTWGNISCRIDSDRFVITPSGIAYDKLELDDIVLVNIKDLSYQGNIKPSSEKGIHASVYKIKKDMNFVIHTHQTNASSIAASGLEEIRINSIHSKLDGIMYLAKYALPGTKSLMKNVEEALNKTKIQAVLMKYHGVVCYGLDALDALDVALKLEESCQDYIVEYFKEESKCNDETLLSSYALTKTLERRNSKTKEVSKALFESYTNIKLIKTPEINALAENAITLKPLLDDFAQLTGLHAPCVDCDNQKIIKALKKYPVIIVKDVGAILLAKNDDELTALELVTIKACKAYIVASLIGKVKAIAVIERLLMRYVYITKYSKKANKGGR